MITKLSIIPRAGLGTRIKAMASGMQIAKELEVVPTIYWNATGNCKARFSDLFPPPSTCKIVENRGLLHSIPDKRRNLNTSKLLQYLNYDQCIYNFNGWNAPDDWNDIMQEIHPQTRSLLICSCYVMRQHPWIGAWLHPSEELQKVIESETINYGAYTVGLHVRGTDNVAARELSTLAKFIEQIEAEMSLHPEVKFYLATDEPMVKKELKARYGNLILTTEAELSRSTVNGMKCAVVEMFCLSRCNKIYGSYYSTFSDVAAQLGQVELIIV